MPEVWQEEEGPTCAGGRGGRGGRCAGPAGALGPDRELGEPGCVRAQRPRVTHSREGPHRSGRASHPPKHSGKERGRAGVWGERRAPERGWSAGSPARNRGAWCLFHECVSRRRWRPLHDRKQVDGRADVRFWCQEERNVVRTSEKNTACPGDLASKDEGRGKWPGSEPPRG